MKKILLVGELGNIARSLNECLIHDFQVQLCPKEPENVQAMVKIVKPDAIMFCQIGIDEAEQSALSWLADNSKNIPVIVITTNEIWTKCAGEPWCDKVSVMLRPVLKSAIIDKCHELMGDRKVESTGFRARKNRNDRKKIMLVDDSAIMLRTMKNMLDTYFDICLAKSGEQALKLIPEEQPDLILLDYEMDGMNGRETFEAMRENEDMKEIPVVFLTSVMDKKSIYSVLKSKPDGYILKPPDREKILSTIEEILG